MKYRKHVLKYLIPPELYSAKVLLFTLNSLSPHIDEEPAQGRVFLQPIHFFSQHTLPYHRVRVALVLLVDPPRDNSVVVIHKDQPVLVPIELLDRSEAVSCLIDPVITGNGVIVEEGFGDLQAALSESVLDGFFTETICRFGFRSEDLTEVGCVKRLKHHIFWTSP
jgi:hypothetical protein